MNARPTLNAGSSYKEICERLKELTTELICDAYPNVRLMDRHKEKKIHPISTNDQCVGRAYTINSAQDSLSIMDSLDDLPTFIALLNCKEDMVPIIMIIASCGADYALVGGVCARAAAKGGFGGLITDGYYRDKKEVVASGLPFFAKEICAISGTKDKVGTTKKIINCGDVEVLPGDVVLGDPGGVVVLSKEEAIAAIPKAEELKQKEEILLHKIEVENLPFYKTCNLKEHIHHLNEGIPSKLKMT